MKYSFKDYLQDDTGYIWGVRVGRPNWQVYIFLSIVAAIIIALSPISEPVIIVLAMLLTLFTSLLHYIWYFYGKEKKDIQVRTGGYVQFVFLLLLFFYLLFLFLTKKYTF